jgi:NAD(P)-dependent dehydrogenase (short-subunit alcohol dehydrogenase family)
VNLTGVFYTLQESARVMEPGGAIVATASTNAFFVEADTASYSASKGGVWTLVRAAALDLAPKGIRVNGICPGSIDTRMVDGLRADQAVMDAYLAKVPMRRLGRPSEIAATAAWLVSDESSFMTGQLLTVDGGITIGVGTRSTDG